MIALVDSVTVLAASEPKSYWLSLSATDNGLPPRTAYVTFTMSVRTNGTVIVVPAAPPVFEQIFSVGGQVSFTIETVPGRAYRVAYTDDLGLNNWTQLDRDFVAANTTASLTDGLGNPQRFYRVQRLD